MGLLLDAPDSVSASV